MSGLQVGYFSLDPLKLQLLQVDKDADQKDQQRAKSAAATAAQQQQHAQPRSLTSLPPLLR